MSETPRTDDLDSKTKGRSWPLACGEHIELSRQLERELSAMTYERDAARDMLRLKELCDMPADYAAMVQRLEEERDALRETVADYRLQLCTPDDCKREANGWHDFWVNPPATDGKRVMVSNNGTIDILTYYCFEQYGLGITHWRDMPEPPIIEVKNG